MYTLSKKISFTWWGKAPMIEDTELHLEEQAIEHIFEMIKEGYWMGDLCYETDNQNYKGSWSYE